MANSTERKQIGGEAVHISDCRVWAEISYLDSSTDYREYLPQNRDRSCPRPGDDFIMLDSSRPLSRSDPKRVWGLGLACVSSLSDLVIPVLCLGVLLGDTEPNEGLAHCFERTRDNGRIGSVIDIGEARHAPRVCPRGGKSRPRRLERAQHKILHEGALLLI